MMAQKSPCYAKMASDTGLHAGRDAGLGQSSVAMDTTFNSARSPMGIREVVVSWDAESLIRMLAGRAIASMPRFRLARPQKLSAAWRKAIWPASSSIPAIRKPSQIDEDLRQLRSAFPRLPVLVLNARGKQPADEGTACNQAGWRSPGDQPDGPALDRFQSRPGEARPHFSPATDSALRVPVGPVRSRCSRRTAPVRPTTRLRWPKQGHSMLISS